VLLPFLLVLNEPGQSLTWLDGVGIFIWLVGFLFEAIGDWQLLQFKKLSKNKGRIIQTGMWRYTRHPNYFGEATLWWGVFIIALSAGSGLLAVTSPLLINFLLLKVSGIPMLEVKYEGHPEFEDYKRRTNAFFPWFPKNGANN
jgi:steroid 5-alpha reductase family enzyme